MCIRLCAFVRAFTSVILGATDGDALGLALGEDGSETSGGHDGADASDAPGIPAGTLHYLLPVCHSTSRVNLKIITRLKIEPTFSKNRALRLNSEAADRKISGCGGSQKSAAHPTSLCGSQ